MGPERPIWLGVGKNEDGRREAERSGLPTYVMEDIVHRSRECWVEGAYRYEGMECCREGKFGEVVDG
jgi:hypothetical protein